MSTTRETPDNPAGGRESRADVLAGQAAAVLGIAGVVLQPKVAGADEPGSMPLEYQPALAGLGYGKPRMRYSDFELAPSGLQYKVVREGSGDCPVDGDRVVVDWEGWTIGYYGKPFEMRQKVKGGAFDADKEFLRFTLGKQPMIPAVEEAVKAMKPGAVRQLIVPPELGYPADDPDHSRVGPKPNSFGGERTLDFVLQNKGLIDKTLLINVKLIRVDKPGQRGFKG